MFVERAAEARCCVDVTEPPHRIVPLLDAAMILLDAILEIVVAAVRDLFAQ